MKCLFSQLNRCAFFGFLGFESIIIIISNDPITITSCHRGDRSLVVEKL